MNKGRIFKGVVSCLLAAAMTVTSVPITSAAAGETYAGDAVTTRVAALTDERTQLFNMGWKFFKGNPSNAHEISYNDSEWELVDLPHDFSILEDFSTSNEAESGFLPAGTGWYRKSFVMPEKLEGKNVVLDFDGVYNEAIVYVNGTQVGNHVYGYTPFGLDITDYLNDNGAENVIAVKAIHQYPSSRWYSGSGMYRNVYLTITDAVHVDYNGTTVTTPDLESQKNGDVTVNIEADIVNDSDENASVVIKNTVFNEDGVQVSDTASTEVTINANAGYTLSETVTVNQPQLWTLDDPVMYKVVTEVTSGSNRDVYETDFGFRYFAFSKTTGFSLNGERMKLKGVCMHHDQGALGAAAYREAIERQLVIMKDMGCNMIRITHNPASRDMIDLCNKMGFLVIEEAFDTWKNPKNGNVNDYSKYFASVMNDNPNMFGYESGMIWAEFDVKSMVDRDKNAPSIILWSIGNEVLEGINGNSSDYASVAQNLIDWIQEVDTTRPTTFGDNKIKNDNPTAVAIANVIHNEGGIVGFNYSSDEQYDSKNSNYDWIIMGAETSSAVNSRGYYKYDSYVKDNNTRELTSYDTSAVSWGRTANSSWQSVITRDAISGEAVWTGFDYIGEPTPWNNTSAGATTNYGATPNSSYFGIVDTAGFPKDTYYYYQSQWNDEVNTLHIVPGSWNSADLELNSNKVWVNVYSDAAAVELFLNGASLGRQSFTEYTTAAGFKYQLNNGLTYLSWNVPYAEGTLHAVAYDRNGNVISDTEGTDRISTVYQADTMTITANKSSMKADGQSLGYFEISIPDTDGNAVNSAEPMIAVSLEGNGVIAGVDNGDASEIDKFQNTISEDRKTATIDAYHGKALVIVKSETTAGTIQVTINADGYGSASAVIQTESIGDAEKITAESYTMVKEYTIAKGTVPTLLQDAAVTLTDGTVVNGVITWENIPEETYTTEGNYLVRGTLSYQDYQIPVSATLVVIAQVAAIKNYSTATLPGCLPILPDTRPGVMANGMESGMFSVTWDMPDVSAFAAMGSTVLVQGTVDLLGQTMPVTASVRVSDAVSGENIAGIADADADQYVEDLPSRAIDGVNNRKGYTSWTRNRTYDSSSFWLEWGEAYTFDHLLLYLRNDETKDYSMLPRSIDVYISENAAEPHCTVSSGITAEAPLRIDLGIIKTDYIKLVFHYTAGYWIMLDEVEAYKCIPSFYSGSSLESMVVEKEDVKILDGTYQYSVEVNNLGEAEVESVQTKENAAATILPKMEDTQYILVESEDDSINQIYQVAFTEKVVAEPTPEVGVLTTASLRTNVDTLEIGEKATLSLYDVFLSDGTDATYTCNADLHIISGTAHLDGFELTATETGTVTVQATVTLNGVSIDTNTVTITVNGEVLDMDQLNNAISSTSTYVTNDASYRYTKASYDHITAVRNEAIKLKSSKTLTNADIDEICAELEAAEQALVERTVPEVELSLGRVNSKFRICGKVAALADDSDNYCKIEEYGILYIKKSRLMTRPLTVNTSGRVKLSFTSHNPDGSYTYNLSAVTTTKYSFVGYVRYYDHSGKLVYKYTPIQTASISEL